MAAKCVAEHEIEKFRRLQRHWWDPAGPLRSLHLFNPVRVRYISDTIRRYSAGRGGAGGGLPAGVRVLDVGCGGGILSESLARLGADVTGIDACAESVAVAEGRRAAVAAAAAARGRDWTGHLRFANTSLFDVSEQYDAVVATEVIEHVDDARAFLEALCARTRPGGLLVLSTMDKSLLTALTHVGLAEQLTGLVHPGTHDWRRFVPPNDVTAFARRFDVNHVDTSFIVSYPDLHRSAASRDFQINFCLSQRLNTGHYFWAGLKVADAAPPTGEEEVASKIN